MVFEGAEGHLERVKQVDTPPSIYNDEEIFG